jgi:3'(2'), 5'-bisphosphate nucleotidase/myo-inositol-1(or 4)-monophosphatase
VELSESDLFELGKTAIHAATAAGKLIKSSQGKEVAWQHKVGGSSKAAQIVTEVDLESQKIILELLEPSSKEFDLALLTEESIDDKSRLEKDFFWCIDPLDGTLPFTESVPGYSVSIALVSKEGTPKIGVVYDPRTETLYHAVAGQGALSNRKPWIPNQYQEEKLTFHTDRSFLEDKLFELTLNELQRIAVDNKLTGLETVKSGGAAMLAVWTLSRAPACYFKFPKEGNGGGCLWDFAATACIFNELNAPASDIYGNSLDLNRSDSVYILNSYDIS